VKDFHLQSSAHAGHTFDAHGANAERGLDCTPIRGENPAPIDINGTSARSTACASGPADTARTRIASAAVIRAIGK
jgi:hypothetical protein